MAKPNWGNTRSKGLWRHVEGTMTALKPYMVVNQVSVLSDGKTPAMEEQIEVRDMYCQS